MVLFNTNKTDYRLITLLVLVAKYLRVLTLRPVLRIFCTTLVQDGSVARTVSPTDDQSPPQGSAEWKGTHGIGFYHISANYRVYCRMVIGFSADDVNSLIFIAKFSGFMFSFCIIWPIQWAIHDDKNTHDDLVIEQKV